MCHCKGLSHLNSHPEMSQANRPHCSVNRHHLQKIRLIVVDGVVIRRALLQQVRRRRSSSRGAPAAYSSHCPRPCLSICRRRQPLSISSRDSSRMPRQLLHPCLGSLLLHAAAAISRSRSTCSLPRAACTGKSDSGAYTSAHSSGLCTQQDEGYWMLHAWCMWSQTLRFQPYSWCMALGAQNVATSIRQLIGKQNSGVLHALGSAGRLYRVSHQAKRAREQQIHPVFCPLLHCIKTRTGSSGQVCC